MGDKKKGGEGGFGKFLWNSETGECMGRTGSSWGKFVSVSFYEIILV